MRVAGPSGLSGEPSAGPSPVAERPGPAAGALCQPAPAQQLLRPRLQVRRSPRGLRDPDRAAPALARLSPARRVRAARRMLQAQVRQRSKFSTGCGSCLNPLCMPNRTSEGAIRPRERFEMPARDCRSGRTSHAADAVLPANDSPAVRLCGQNAGRDKQSPDAASARQAGARADASGRPSPPAMSETALGSGAVRCLEHRQRY